MTWLPLSLSRRVALATALVAALAALVAAVVSLKIAEQLIDEAERDHLVATAEIFLNDLDMRDASTTLEQAIAEEMAELAPASVRIAVYERARHVGGDRVPMPNERCTLRAQGSLVERACRDSHGPLTVVAATTRAGGASRRFVLGSALAGLVAAIGAAAIGQRAARWAIAPLRRLTSALDRVHAEDPGARALPEPGKIAVLHEAISGLVERLAEALSRARRFSADAAHELGTPLTVLSAQIELLLEESTPADRRAELLLLQLRVRTLGRLVERLLVLATSEQALAVNGEPVALEDVVRQCVRDLTDEQQSRVILEIESQGMARGDESLLGVLVENALDNALKFSGQGVVTLRVSETPSHVLLDVVDDGPGLNESEKERAFDAFFRAPAARAEGLAGHGIGLALVARVSRQHGGACAFLDAKRGAHLQVSLPAWRPAH